MEQQNKPKKKSVYNRNNTNKIRKRYFNISVERYRMIHKKDLNIKVSTGTFTFYFDFFLFMKDKNVCNYKKAEMYPV